MWATQFAQMQFVAEKNGWTKFISMQNQYSLLYREEEREMNRFCDATGVGLIPVSALHFPFYFSKSARQKLADKNSGRHSVEAISQDHSRSLVTRREVRRRRRRD